MPTTEELMQTAIDALSLGSLYALLALGVALIFGVMGLVNFAHGELIMVGAYVLFFVGDRPVLVLVLVAAAAAALAAFIMEKVAFRPVRGANPATLMVTSFALSYMIQNLVIVLMGAHAKSLALQSVGAGNYFVGGLRIAKLNVLTLFITILLLAALAAFLSKTSLGLQMRAAAENFEMARLLGVRADRVISAAFVIGGALAGVAAVLLVAQTGTASPRMGLGPLLVAVVAMVIGGIGRLGGAVLGGLLLGSLSAVLQAYLPLEWRPFRDAVAFAIVIVILLFRPQGLLPSRTSTRV